MGREVRRQGDEALMGYQYRGLRTLIDASWLALETRGQLQPNIPWKNFPGFPEVLTGERVTTSRVTALASIELPRPELLSATDLLEVRRSGLVEDWFDVVDKCVEMCHAYKGEGVSRAQLQADFQAYLEAASRRFKRQAESGSVPQGLRDLLTRHFVVGLAAATAAGAIFDRGTAARNAAVYSAGYLAERTSAGAAPDNSSLRNHYAYFNA